MLSDVWRYGDIEMGRCPRCGSVPLATVCNAISGEVPYESEFEAIAINDGTHNYFLRLARLVPEYNVVQLKKMEITADGRRIVPLGIQTNTVDVPTFMERAAKLRLAIELTPVSDNGAP